MINRLIELPKKKSFFLFGPRQTGKSTLIHARYPRDIWTVDLLLSELFFKYAKDPSLFRREAAYKIRHERVKTIFVDEVQRIPIILNEIQSLMGEFDCQFILTGSSARKLKRGGANLLAGRAVVRYLFPFVYEEIKSQFDLDSALLFGSLPALIGKTEGEKIDVLNAYADTYLREEIQNEGIVRNLGGFSRFLDMAASQSGELVSFSAIGRECHLPTRTVQSYYEILEDTLIGLRLEPWRKSVRKRLTGHPKFYFFDLGVTNAINRRLRTIPDPMLKGRLFEQFVILETYRMLHYQQADARLYFWRTNHGAEVDLLVEKHNKIVAGFEIKAASNISGAHLSSLRVFQEEYPKALCAVICLADQPHELDDVQILPWRHYLSRIDSFL